MDRFSMSDSMDTRISLWFVSIWFIFFIGLSIWSHGKNNSVDKLSLLPTEEIMDEELDIHSEFVTKDAVRKALISSITAALKETNKKYGRRFELVKDSLKIKETVNGK